MEKFDWKLTIKTNLFFLKMLGLWPESKDGYGRDLYSLYAFVSRNAFMKCHIFFQVMKLFFVYNDLEAVTAIIFVIVTKILTTMKAYYFVKNTKQLKDLMETLDDEYFQPRNSEQRDLVKPGLNLWKLTYIGYHFPVLPTLTGWAIFPITDGSYKDHRLPFSAWYPYDINTSPFYEITYIYQVISVWFLAIACLNMDTLVAALMAYVGSQCEILSDNAKNMGKLNKSLIECVIHHRKIISFAANCNQFFDQMVLGQFITSALTLALSMFQLSVLKPLSSESNSLLFYSTSMTIEIFLYCWFGNEVEIKVSGVTITCSIC